MKHLNVNTTGNRKLQNTDSVRFMIWNIPAVKTCPFRTPSCEKSCYARKAERVYPQVLPSREQNFVDTQSIDFVENMIYTIEKELNSKKFDGKKCIFRIHESGDFYNIYYASKWLRIARHFSTNDRIVFLAYTKSISYFVELGYGSTEFPENLIIRSSLWADTAQNMVDLTNNYNFPIYTALTMEKMREEENNGHIFTRCDCYDCANCGNCWNKDCKDIICKIH